VPWPDGYACDFQDAKYNVRRLPAGRLAMRLHFRHAQSQCAALLRLSRWHHKPIDEWLDRQPGRQIARVARPTGSSTRATGSSPTTIRARPIMSCSRTSPARDGEPGRPTVANKGMSYYSQLARHCPECTLAYHGATRHHFKTSGPAIRKRAGGLWAVEGPCAGTAALSRSSCAAAMAPVPRRFSTWLHSEPVEHSMCPNFSLLATTSRCSDRQRRQSAAVGDNGGKRLINSLARSGGHLSRGRHP